MSLAKWFVARNISMHFKCAKCCKIPHIKYDGLMSVEWSLREVVIEVVIGRNIIPLHTITTILPVFRDLLKGFKSKGCEDVLEDQKP